MTYLTIPIPLPKSARSDKASEEARTLVRRCAEPCPAGDSVKEAIARAANRLGLPFTRTRDIWYGDARRIEAWEMDRMRAQATMAEVELAISGIEALRARLRASPTPLSREVLSSLDDAMRVLGRDTQPSHKRRKLSRGDACQ